MPQLTKDRWDRSVDDPSKDDDSLEPTPLPPAVLGPAGKPDEVIHAIDLGLLSVTKDFLVAAVDVVESGSPHGAHAVIHWKDGSTSAIWDKGVAPDNLGSIEQVDQIQFVTVWAYYPDDSSLHLDLLPRTQLAKSKATAENSHAQQRLYRIRNLAETSDIPHSTAIPRVYGHRVAALFALAIVSLAITFTTLTIDGGSDDRQILFWFLLAAQIVVVGSMLALARKWPIWRPPPDVVILKHSAGKKSSESRLTYIGVAFTAIAAVAGVIALFI